MFFSDPRRNRMNGLRCGCFDSPTALRSESQLLITTLGVEPGLALC
jgi:hypothetical protein